MFVILNDKEKMSIAVSYTHLDVYKRQPQEEWKVFMDIVHE